MPKALKKEMYFVRAKLILFEDKNIRRITKIFSNIKHKKYLYSWTSKIKFNPLTILQISEILITRSKRMFNTV